MNGTRRNCWEVMDCGCQPGLPGAAICPVMTAVEYNGVNHGKNAGRFCWAVAGTLCGGIAQGPCARRLGACTQCGFYLEVEMQEGRVFARLPMDAGQPCVVCRGSGIGTGTGIICIACGGTGRRR